MVVANLLKKVDPALNNFIKHPFTPKDILYIDLQPLTNNKTIQIIKNTPCFIAKGFFIFKYLYQ